MSRPLPAWMHHLSPGTLARRALGSLPLVGLLAAGEARAETVSLNVSQLVTGTVQLASWATWDTLPQLPCGACTYSSSSTALISPASAPSCAAGLAGPRRRRCPRRARSPARRRRRRGR